MSTFTPEEIAYLQSQRYGRLATVSQTGELHVVPVTFRYHPEYESIDIGGENLTQTKKYRDAVRHGRVAFVVDDVLPPMHMRMVEIRGTVEGLPVGGKEMMASFAPEILRITPTRIISFGLLQERWTLFASISGNFGFDLVQYQQSRDSVGSDRLFSEAAMLDDDAYRNYLDQCRFSDSARTLLTDIRRSPPVRRVARGRGNIHGRYPSRKMGRTIQFESHTELGAIYIMEHDPGVLEYWDQPTKLKLHYRGPSGRRVTNWHPPDFLVLRQEEATFEEWKREEELARLVKEHSDRYQRHPSLGYRSAPGEAAAEALGLLYRVRSSRELSAVFVQNLQFLEDYWVTPWSWMSSIVTCYRSGLQHNQGFVWRKSWSPWPPSANE